MFEKPGKISIEQRLKPGLRNPFQAKLMMKLIGSDAGPEAMENWVKNNAGPVSDVIDAPENQSIRDLIIDKHTDMAIKAVCDMLGWDVKIDHAEAA